DYADAHCPELPKHIQKEHWPLNDPVGGDLDDNKRMRRFREVRDEIQERVKSLLKRLRNLD
ncbi:hypothetical protein JYT87_02655, partial [Nitrospira defluvii]|nr:hypothetical protein [Nitrospira defluvii]